MFINYFTGQNIFIDFGTFTVEATKQSIDTFILYIVLPR